MKNHKNSGIKNDNIALMWKFAAAITKKCHFCWKTRHLFTLKTNFTSKTLFLFNLLLLPKYKELCEFFLRFKPSFPPPIFNFSPCYFSKLPLHKMVSVSNICAFFPPFRRSTFINAVYIHREQDQIISFFT